MSGKKRIRAERVARLFKLVASETRAALILLLAKHKKLSVQEVAESLSMTHSAVSHQLSVLLRSNIVSVDRVGRQALYRLAKNPRAQALARFLLSV